MEYYQQARQLALELDDRQLLRSAVEKLGYVYFKLGRFNEAKTFILDAHAVTDSDEDPEAMVNELNLLGKVCHRLGNPEEALKYYMKAFGYADRLSYSIFSAILITVSERSTCV